MIELEKRFLKGNKEIYDIRTGEILSIKTDLEKHISRALNNQRQKADPLFKKQLFLEVISKEKH